QRLTMPTCGAWLLKHAATPQRWTFFFSLLKPPVFMSVRCSWTLILRLLGRGSLVWARLFTSIVTPPPLGEMQRNVLWKMHGDCNRTRLKRCSPWLITNTGCCVITG